jgi:hypothetical protein
MANNFVHVGASVRILTTSIVSYGLRSGLDGTVTKWYIDITLDVPLNNAITITFNSQLEANGAMAALDTATAAANYVKTTNLTGAVTVRYGV